MIDVALPGNILMTFLILSIIVITLDNIGTVPSTELKVILGILLSLYMIYNILNIYFEENYNENKILYFIATLVLLIIITVQSTIGYSIIALLLIVPLVQLSNKSFTEGNIFRKSMWIFK